MSKVQRITLAALLSIVLVAPARAGEAVDPASAKPEESGYVLFYDVRALGLEGQAWSDVAAPFDRLPAKAQGVVRDAVWGLSRHSAGLCVRFETDADAVHARWTLTSANLAMPHMPATGVSGLDLYVKADDGRWRWLANGRPGAQANTAALVQGLPPGRREYVLYLPLYNGVSSVEIGLPKGASVFKPEPRPAGREKPVVFYGTSITQGGCASRPGMCHTAILGRRLDRPVVNLGFSGNGTMDPEMGALLGEVDAAAFVIDCLPNMNAEAVAARAGELVRTIRKTRPATPILLVEDRTHADAFLRPPTAQGTAAKRAALRKAFDALVAAGDKNLAYLPGDGLLGADGEDTVDGSHPTDLGFIRHADAFEPVLRKLIDNE
jgi:lysophospholipase L1-like esterase